MLHDFLPCPRSYLRVSPVNVDPRQRKIHVRLVFGIVVCLEQSERFRLVAGFETGLRSSRFVLDVKNSPRTFYQTIRLFHRLTHGCECATVGECRVSEHWASVDRTEAKF